MPPASTYRSQGPSLIPPPFRVRQPVRRRPDRRMAGIQDVEIFTDGACKGKPGPGGWGAILRQGERELELSGGAPLTTNNRMEMTAAIEGLKALKRPCKVTLYTDSVYVRDGITKWIFGWQRNGWRTADRKPVKNAELWQDRKSTRLNSSH